MAGAEPRARARWLALGGLLAACATASYSAYPVDLPRGLPPDAFATCRAVLVERYGALEVADAAAFRLQTGWAPCDDLPGERRASVFRQRGAVDGLGVVVELRRLREPVVGLPHWTAPRGDADAERELGELLRTALNP